jgi:hypothetical protein
MENLFRACCTGNDPFFALSVQLERSISYHSALLFMPWGNICMMKYPLLYRLRGVQLWPAGLQLVCNSFAVTVRMRKLAYVMFAGCY